MTASPLRFHIVSHTHWDREWYQPFETFRLRLVDLFDHLLEIYEQHPDYVFELDAQTICLEDYLEIRPHRRAELERHIRSGNLRVGPWYVQNDFALTSGEATVRNLLIGSRIAREFGRCGDVGYAPDQFGLIRQLPQILAGFDIDSCIFGRGFDRRTKNEFFWDSPDGSRVICSFLSRWYNNLQRLSADPAKAAGYAAQAIAEQDDEAATSHRLLMNGVDHLEAQEDLPEVLKHLPGFRQSTLRDFIDAVKAESANLPAVDMEMRDSDALMLLPGTLSVRSPLKAANAEAQAKLEWRLEPLGVMLALETGDWSFVETDMLDYAWKLLLQNHPHDSICGCSTDRVHIDNFNRFARLADLTSTLEARLFRRFFERLDRTGLAPEDYLVAVFNPAPHGADREAAVKCYFPLDENVERFEILDASGCAVDFEVAAVRRRALANFPAINLPGRTDCLEVDVKFSARNLPPMGCRVYTVRPHRGQPVALPERCRLENEFLSFQVDDHGRLTLAERESGRIFTDLVTFRDEADTGHSYNFFPEPNRREIDIPAISRIAVAHRSDCVEVEYRFELPRDYDFPNRRRTAETVENRLTVRYSLARHAKHLSVDFELDNRSAAHRLRAVFNVDDLPGSTASTPFGFECRERKKTVQGAPNSGAVAVGNLAVFNMGLCEYEHRADGALALTLLRCVGRVTNSEYANQQQFVAESYEWEAPGANSIGIHRFRAAIRPGTATLAALESEYRAFAAPPPAAFDSADARKFTSGRPCVQDTALTEIFFRPLPPGTKLLPREISTLSIDGEAVFSALKRAETGDVAILRIYNPDFRNGCRIELDGRHRYVKCSLAEAPLGETEPVLELRPGEILTLKLSS